MRRRPAAVYDVVTEDDFFSSEEEPDVVEHGLHQTGDQDEIADATAQRSGAARLTAIALSAAVGTAVLLIALSGHGGQSQIRTIARLPAPVAPRPAVAVLPTRERAPRSGPSRRSASRPGTRSHHRRRATGHAQAASPRPHPAPVASPVARVAAEFSFER